LEEPVVYERIVLEWIFRMWDKVDWTGFIWLRIRRSGRHL
jgi:hypothetical protein